LAASGRERIDKLAPFPKGRKELERAGYVFVREGVCKAPECGALIRWYRTPVGEMMPIDSITEGPHWQACGGADFFRKKKKKPEPAPDPQLNMFEKPMREPGED
jgi:hypothetical protein